MSPLQRRKISRLFALYDRSGDGVLAREDWELFADTVARARGHERGGGDHERITREFLTHFERYKAVADFSRDGQITEDEWLDFFEIVFADEVALDAIIGSLVGLAFRTFDVDDDAMLELDELVKLGKALGFDTSEVPALFAALDTNGDGVLSSTEVRRAIVEFLVSDDPDAHANRFFMPDAPVEEA